jgi:signal transduction histidine kinase
VRLRADAIGRVPGAVETAAYFVVSEALTNVAKHAIAAAVRITVERHDGRLLVEVADDGPGGATIDAGSGLRGLSDRSRRSTGAWSCKAQQAAARASDASCHARSDRR